VIEKAVSNLEGEICNFIVKDKLSALILLKLSIMSVHCLNAVNEGLLIAGKRGNSQRSSIKIFLEK